MSIFAPADYFSCLAITIDNDPDLQRGTHLRILPSVKLGLPLSPVALWRVRARLAEPQVLWRNSAGQPVNPPDLDAAGGTLYGDIIIPTADQPQYQMLDIAVDVQGTFTGVAALVDAVHADGREYCRRSARPYLLSAPRVNRLKLQGRGIPKLEVWRLSPSLLFEELLNTRPQSLLSLPIAGSLPWYTGGLGKAQAFNAVSEGAPLRLTPADLPEGPFSALTGAHEEARVLPHTEAIIDTLERILGDPQVRPGMHRLSHEGIPPDRAELHTFDYDAQSQLLMQAMDPGLARFIGLAKRVENVPAPGEPVAWIAMSLFAVPTVGIGPIARVAHDVLGEQPPMLGRLVERYRQEVENASGGAADFQTILSRIAQMRTVHVRPVLCAGAAVPAPDRPLLAKPELPPDRLRWIGNKSSPSNGFQQDFIWPAIPLGGMVALGRKDDGQWRSRHRDAPLAAGSDSPPRKLPLLMGRSGSWQQGTKGLLSDQPIPANPGVAVPPPVSYRCALADLFGRFGPPVEFDVKAPPRPAPPVPKVQAEVILDGPTGTQAGPLSPGKLKLSIPVPHVADLPAGSLTPAGLRLVHDSVQLPDILLESLPFPDPAMPRKLQMVEQLLPLPALDVAARATGKLSAQFVNAFGATSEPSDIRVSYNDRRPYPVVPCGLGLFWTSRPGPAPEVELSFAWPAPKGARYRIYIADARSLGLPAGPRANQAVDAGNRARDKLLGARDRFRLLTTVEENGGQGRLNEKLPRSLTELQVLRIVPVTPNGQEAPFDDCPVVPVAVPSERRMAMPSLSVMINRDNGRPHVSIRAQGDTAWLAALEPGLFSSPPDPEAKAPEFRLRCTLGNITDPLYARQVASGPLSVKLLADGSCEGTAEFNLDDALPPFVRAVWWVEVRPGAERRVRAGYAEPSPEGGVFPLNSLQGEDASFGFSMPSAPVVTLYAPPLARPEVSNAQVRVVGAQYGLHFDVLSPPATHPRAKKYRLRVWEQWGNDPLQLAGNDIILNGAPVSWAGPLHDIAGPQLPASLVVAYVDPLDQVGPMTRVEAVPPAP
jgi:hypothetical protein